VHHAVRRTDIELSEDLNKSVNECGDQRLQQLQLAGIQVKQRHHGKYNHVITIIRSINHGLVDRVGFRCS